jgi:calcineurin-like phosphoesterase family protein
MSQKNRQRGKRTERKIAELLNGRRLGVLGKHDVESELFGVEVKSREKLPKWFVDFWKQTIANCPKDKTPLLVIHKLNQRYDDDWVVIKMKDFLEMIDDN